MVIRTTTAKKTNARMAAAKARQQGFNASFDKNKKGRYAVSVVRK